MRLTPHDIAKMLDHSTLQPFLTDEDICKGCELALRYDTASVCARPCDMPLVASLLRGSDVKVCTVIGFPHGTHRTCMEAVLAALEVVRDDVLELGAEGIDLGTLLTDDNAGPGGWLHGAGHGHQHRQAPGRRRGLCTG